MCRKEVLPMDYEQSTLCMYDGKTMTVAEYKRKPGVAEFEHKLKELALQSAYCRADRTSVFTDELYSVFREGFPTHQNRRCLYFEKYVLPSEPALEADYWALMQGGKINTTASVKGACKRCNNQFTKQARNQAYCTNCKKAKEKEKKHRYYLKKKAAGQVTSFSTK